MVCLHPDTAWRGLAACFRSSAKPAALATWDACSWREGPWTPLTLWRLGTHKHSPLCLIVWSSAERLVEEADTSLEGGKSFSTDFDILKGNKPYVPRGEEMPGCWWGGGDGVVREISKWKSSLWLSGCLCQQEAGERGNGLSKKEEPKWKCHFPQTQDPLHSLRVGWILNLYLKIDILPPSMTQFHSYSSTP